MLLIPVDRTPDEMHHFRLIKARHLELTGADEQTQAEIAAQIKVTVYYLMYPKSTRKVTAADYKNERLPAPPASTNLYYTINALILRVLTLDNLSAEIYAIRTMSIAWGLIVVLLAFLVAQELFPDNLFMIIGVPALITFIPQVTAMNASINNDKLAEVFAALLFFLLVKVFRQNMTFWSFLGCVGLIGLAILSKRTALFAVPWFLVAGVVYWWKGRLGIAFHLILAASFLALMFVGYQLMWLSPAVNNFITDRFVWAPMYRIKGILFNPFLYSVEALTQYFKFFIVLYWSFWGVFGYMTIHLHHFWYMLAAVAQLTSIVGILWSVIRVKMKRMVLEQWKAKTLYLFAMSIIFSVAVMFFRSNIFRGNGEGMPEFTLTQGRYLFPVLIPIAVMTLWGLSIVIPRKYHRLAGIFGLLGLFIMDSVCLSKYLLLHFYLISIV